METENRKATFKEEQETLKSICAKIKLDKEIDRTINKKMPKLLEIGYKRKLPKQLLIDIVKDTMMTDRLHLLNNYFLKILSVDTKDSKYESKLKKIEHKYEGEITSRKIVLIKMLDYIEKNYKPNNKEVS